jgi:hypothetical protein
MKLIWRNGIFVPDDGNAAASSQINAEAMFLAMLDAYTKQERNVSAVTGTSYAPTIFSRDPACKGVDMKVLRDAMNSLFAKHQIKVENFGPPSRQRSKIVRA